MAKQAAEEAEKVKKCMEKTKPGCSHKVAPQVHGGGCSVLDSGGRASGRALSVPEAMEI